jgi:hypothetical protein
VSTTVIVTGDFMLEGASLCVNPALGAVHAGADGEGLGDGLAEALALGEALGDGLGPKLAAAGAGSVSICIVADEPKLTV